MGSIFGGAQTVPTLQNTFQNQAGQSTSQTAANNLAITGGQDVTSLLQQMGQQPYGNNPFIPTRSVSSPTAQFASAINNPYNLSNSLQAGIYPSIQQNLVGAGGLIGTGAGMAQQAGAPITQNDIGSFFNPFAANVTANLQDIFGQQNTQNLLGSTQAAGGAGSERSAVGQALLAQRQQLTAGNIYADLYQRSLQAAEQQKAQQLASAQGVTGAGGAMGQLGVGQVGALNQTNASALQSSLAFQNLIQQQMDAPYQAQLAQYEDPYRRLAAMSGATYPLIGLGQTGATTQNINAFGQGAASTQFPGPPILPQIAGLGLAGAALFAARGGRIKKKSPYHFQDGGEVDVTGLDQPLGAEDAGMFGGEAAPMGGAPQPEGVGAAPQGSVGGFGGQGDTEASPATQSGPGGTPSPEAKVAASRTPEEKSTARRNQYALMQSMLKGSISGARAAPKINWPSQLTMGRQEGGRVPDEETEASAHRKLGFQGALSRAANPYFNAGDKNNLYRDMNDPGTRYPIQTGSQYPMSPSGGGLDADLAELKGEAPGLYQDGGAVQEHEPVGLPQMAQAALSDDDDDDEVGGEAAPLGGAPAPAASPANPFNRQVTAPGENAPGFQSGMSPGKLALLQAGLGMLAASGQRDRHGLPMSPLGAVGAGGMEGVNTYQKQQVLAQRERAAQAALGLRKAQMENLERYRQDTLKLRSGMQPGQLKTIQTPLGPKSVIVQPDGSFKDAYSGRSSGEEKSQPAAMVDTGTTDEEKEKSAGLLGQVKAGQSLFKSEHRPGDKNFDDLLDAMQMDRKQFDFLAARYALGDTSVLQGSGNRQAGVAFRRAIQARATQYFLDRDYGPQEANNAMVELQAQKAGARSLANQQGRITGALARAEQTAPVVVGLSDKINRTEYPTLNKLILAAKRHTGDENTIRYGLALETFITNYASATGQGSTVMSDHQRGVMEKRLDEAYSKGQVKAVIDQGMIEINRELRGTQHGMDYYLGRRSPGEENENRDVPATNETTKEQYEKLPSGAHYFKDGKEYIKK